MSSSSVSNGGCVTTSTTTSGGVTGTGIKPSATFNEGHTNNAGKRRERVCCFDNFVCPRYAKFAKISSM